MNDFLFISQTIIGLALVLAAFRLGYVWQVALVASQAALMNIFVLKQMTVFGLVITGGNVLYASIFLSTDMIAEHYGKKRALQTVRIGFAVSLFFLIMSQFIKAYIPVEEEFSLAVNDSFNMLFEMAPRVVAGSMLAYLISQHWDVFVFEAIRKKTEGRHLWLRNNASTMTSQLIDTTIFTFIAFYGVFSTGVFWQIFITTYIIKVLIAALDTPFVYLSKFGIFIPEQLKGAKESPEK